MLKHHKSYSKTALRNPHSSPHVLRFSCSILTRNPQKPTNKRIGVTGGYAGERPNANPPDPSGHPPFARGTSSPASLVKGRCRHSGGRIQKIKISRSPHSNPQILPGLLFNLRFFSCSPILLFKSWYPQNISPCEAGVFREGVKYDYV